MWCRLVLPSGRDAEIGDLVVLVAHIDVFEHADQRGLMRRMEAGQPVGPLLAGEPDAARRPQQVSPPLVVQASQVPARGAPPDRPEVVRIPAPVEQPPDEPGGSLLHRDIPPKQCAEPGPFCSSPYLAMDPYPMHSTL